MIKNYEQWLTESKLNEMSVYDRDNQYTDNCVRKLISLMNEDDVKDGDDKFGIDELLEIAENIFNKKEEAVGSYLEDYFDSKSNFSLNFIDKFFAEFSSQGPRFDRVESLTINPSSDIYGITFIPSTKQSGFQIILTYQEGTEVYTFTKNVIGEFECTDYTLEEDM